MANGNESRYGLLTVKCEFHIPDGARPATIAGRVYFGADSLVYVYRDRDDAEPCLTIPVSNVSGFVACDRIESDTAYRV